MDGGGRSGITDRYADLHHFTKVDVIFDHDSEKLLQESSAVISG